MSYDTFSSNRHAQNLQECWSTIAHSLGGGLNVVCLSARLVNSYPPALPTTPISARPLFSALLLASWPRYSVHTTRETSVGTYKVQLFIFARPKTCTTEYDLSSWIREWEGRARQGLLLFKSKRMAFFVASLQGRNSSGVDGRLARVLLGLSIALALGGDLQTPQTPAHPVWMNNRPCITPQDSHLRVVTIDRRSGAFFQPRPIACFPCSRILGHRCRIKCRTPGQARRWICTRPLQATPFSRSARAR